jgi:hypothetical protein
MNAMVNSPDAPGDDPCTVTGIRAIDEPGEGLAELEITVGCSRASLRKDRPGEHPWSGQFRHRVRRGPPRFPRRRALAVRPYRADTWTA